MAKNWEELENLCYEYLENQYGDIATIEPFGKSDSNNADIRINTQNGNEFFIEVKATNSQCCQFVLFPNEETNKFDFSKYNKVPLSDNCKKIISYMNSSYEYYSKVSTNGLEVDVNSDILYGLVNDFYSIKNVKFFMTKADNYIIFPIDRFSDYFDIKAYYRKKKSGSSEPNEKDNKNEIEQGITEQQINGIIEYITIGSKRRCFLHTNMELHEKRMECSKYTYQFKRNQYSDSVQKRTDNVFEVRRLSNTNNPNVICQLSLKKPIQEKDDLDAFCKSI